MFLCHCEFRTESIRTLRSHYASNHGSGTSFFERFKNEIIENWDSIPGRSIRGFMLWYANYKCSSCGYNKTRECGASILEIDHIDGDHSNNEFSNLRVLCPNCHALTPKYRNWSNTGNKKNAKTLRPGNLGYDKRLERIEARRSENLRAREQRKAQENKLKELKQIEKDQSTIQKNNEKGVYKEFERIKSEFQQNFADRVLQLHESGEIDFGKYGWVQILAEKLEERPQVVGRRIRSLLPDFYVEHCFSRRYNHYVDRIRSKKISS